MEPNQNKSGVPGLSALLREARANWRAQPGYFTSIAVLLLVGVIIRFAVISAAAQRSYLPDHLDALSWGTYAYRHGPLTLYDMPPNQPIFVHDQSHRSGARLQLAAHEFNYPPLSGFLFWFQAWAWNSIEPRSVPLPTDAAALEELKGLGVTSEHRWLSAWTWNAQFASAAPTIPWDILQAFGVMALVRAVRGERRSRAWELVAFGTALLAPALFLNSMFWNQYEVWVTCPCIWSLTLLLRRKFLTAGALFGIALLTKSSALLFGPVLFVALLAFCVRERSQVARMIGAVSRFAGGTVALMALGAMPFALHDLRQNKADWATHWISRSYAAQLESAAYARTTLSAFNVWWIDFIALKRSHPGESMQSLLNPKAVWFGVTKDNCGRAMLLLTMAAAFVICCAALKSSDKAIVGFGCVVLLALFLFPTRVHERYCYFCIPFLIAMFAIDVRWFIPCLLMVIVGSFEATSYLWLNYALQPNADSTGQFGSVALAWSGLIALALCFAFAIRDLQTGISTWRAGRQGPRASSKASA